MSRNVSSTARDLQRHCLQWLLLIIAVVGQGRIAEASCGDYLNNHNHVISHDSSPMSMSDLLATGQQSKNFPICLGPNCRHRDQIPVSPSQEIAPSAVKEATLVTFPVLVPLEQANLALEFQAAAICGPLGRVFRPPRMSGR